LLLADLNQQRLHLTLNRAVKPVVSGPSYSIMIGLQTAAADGSVIRHQEIHYS